MNSCIQCGSYAINHHLHGRDGSDPELCDVCYWRKRAQAAYQQEGRGDLIKRLLAHALIHERNIPQDEEQRQWASDLREAARMLATHPSAGPVACECHHCQRVRNGAQRQMEALQALDGRGRAHR